MASALTLQLNYKMTFIRLMKVLVYFVCTHLFEVIRHMAGKGACTLTKNKAADYFVPLQFGVACPGGTEKIIHHLKGVIEQHWMDPDFAILKVDIFNLVSSKAVVDLCAAHFPELFPYVSWCYSNHQHLWHKLGELVSASGVQQGDPLGPLLLSLVLHATVQAIVADPQCTDLTSKSATPCFEILGAPIGTPEILFLLYRSHRQLLKPD